MNSLSVIARSIRNRGLWGTMATVVTARKYVNAVRGKSGLEIGGPSDSFQRMIPLYPALKSLDNCVFSRETVWEGQRENGAPYIFNVNKKPGVNYVCEASALIGITDQKYDFILSCHSLEHCANPIQALKEWHRVCRESLVLLLPNPKKTFDHQRELTSFEHLMNDYQNRTGEDDLTHLEEILRLHDLNRDPEAGTFEQFHERSKHNFSNRCLHHHVFSYGTVSDILRFSGFTLARYDESGDSMIFLAKRSSTDN